MSLKELIVTCIIILGPSWTVAYVTEKVIYVIPMLAVCTFVCAQMFQNRNKRLEEDDYHDHGHGKDGDH